MQKKMTIAEIAKLSGVGKSTVSRYFNGGYLKESTREKIQKVITEHNYEPNSFARLKAKSSNMIGVVLPTLNSKISSRLITSIDRYLRERGYTTLIKNSDHTVQLELQNIQRLIHLNVDGIILSAISVTKAHTDLIARADVPIVTVGQEIDSGVSIIDDNYRAGEFIGDYVGRAGLKRVAYIGVYETDIAVGRRRRQGVFDGLKKHGIEEPFVILGDYSFESGRECTEKILSQYPAEAIICATDRIAYGAYQVLQEHGLRIPEDVSITGFGGYKESALLHPQLTTIQFDSYGEGYLSAESILKLIRKEPVPEKQIIGYQFIPGNSVKICVL